MEPHMSSPSPCVWKVVEKRWKEWRWKTLCPGLDTHTHTHLIAFQSTLLPCKLICTRKLMSGLGGGVGGGMGWVAVANHTV